MKITNKAMLAVSVMSVMYLTACQSLPKTASHTEVASQPKNTKHNYPATRAHSQTKDIFMSGEFGRPDHLVGEGMDRVSVVLKNPNAAPDTGVNRYFGERQVDKYRWLEEVDLIHPDYQYETSADRQRNFIGTRLEDERPDGQMDTRTRDKLQQVDKNAPKSEVTQWVDAQHSTTMNHLKNIPIYQEVGHNVASLYDFEHTIRKIKTKKAGELHLFRGADGYERVVRTDSDGSKHELWRETDLEVGLRNATGDFYVSEDGSYFALFLSTGGADADRVTLHVFDSLTGKEVRKPKYIGDQGFQGFLGGVWLNDDTFLYNNVAYSVDAAGIYRYKVGKQDKNDPIEILFDEHLESNAWAGAPWLAGKEKRYLVIPTSIKSGPPNSFFIKDLKTGKIYRPHDKKIADKKRKYAEFFILGSFVHLDEKTGDIWLVSGENDEQRGEIVKTNLHNLKKREVVVPVNLDYDYILEAIYHAEGSGYYLIKYMKDGQHRLILTDHKGVPLRDLTPAATGDADALFGHIVGEAASNQAATTSDDKSSNNQNFISFRFTNFTMPRTVYKYSVTQDKFIDVRRRDLYPFKESDYISELVKYRSKDGVEVPMTITYKKGTVLNGKNPTALLGYGGFSAPIFTAFSLNVAPLIEAGGIFAQAHIRGGPEYGDAWHKDGNLLNKKNVFADFEAAADYLFEKGYTSPEYMSIRGGSNGGLLVGAAMTISPHKYRVALPAVGVLDMMRADAKYYMGQWNAEYGSAYDSKEMYDYLKSYSPYQNVKAGVCYPSTMVTTAKRDDRVLPFHSYKFAAALQEHQGCDNPTFLFVDDVQGHGQRTPRQRKEYATAITAFTLDEMGITHVPSPVRPTAEEMQRDDWLDENAVQAKPLN